MYFFKFEVFHLEVLKHTNYYYMSVNNLLTYLLVYIFTYLVTYLPTYLPT
jgi:hypothetical protein